MSKFLQVICLVTAMLFPLLGQVQEADTVGIDNYIEQLSTQCPYELNEGWSISKLEVLDSDTVLLEIRTPASLTAFISLLVVDNEKGRNLWGNHLLQYGDTWRKLLERLMQEGRPLKLAIRPRGCKESYCLPFSPDELGTILAKD